MKKKDAALLAGPLLLFGLRIVPQSYSLTRLIMAVGGGVASAYGAYHAYKKATLE